MQGDEQRAISGHSGHARDAGLRFVGQQSIGPPAVCVVAACFATPTISDPCCELEAPTRANACVPASKAIAMQAAIRRRRMPPRFMIAVDRTPASRPQPNRGLASDQRRSDPVVLVARGATALRLEDPPRRARDPVNPLLSARTMPASNPWLSALLAPSARRREPLRKSALGQASPSDEQRLLALSRPPAVRLRLAWTTALGS